MKTLRYLACPVCDYSMSVEALSRRAVGRLRADIRLCHGRKGLPHVAYEDMNSSEKELIRHRLLAALQMALKEEIITEDDLGLLVPVGEIARGQIPMSVS